MIIKYLFILCGLKVIRGDTKLEFNLDDSGKCVSGQSNVNVGEGDMVRADFHTRKHIYNASCIVRETQKELSIPLSFQRGQDGFYLNVNNITREMSGLWTCHLAFISQRQGDSVCAVRVEVAESIGAHKSADEHIIPFFIESESKECKTELPEGIVYNGKFRIQITATFPLSPGLCYLRTDGTVDRDNIFAKLEQVQKYTNDLKNLYQSEVKEFNSDMPGKTLVCEVKFMQKNKNLTCELPIKSEAVSGTAQGRNLQGSDTSTGIIIGSVVGIIVVLIIVGQTIALLYFRKRAQLRERMDNLRSATKPFDRGDQARYSAPPRQRSPKRENADTDSHIYEMVGVNEMYNAGSHRGKITDIKDRPRLPLPGEAYEEPAAIDETFSRPKPKLHASTLSSEADCAPPPRPAKKETPLLPWTLPKPTANKDEPPSLPGSLRRPPKPVPINGSVPKNMANDTALLELKNVLKKRIVESQSQNSTPEKKIPPIPIKKPQPDPPKKPIGVIPPLSPPEPIPPANSRTSNLKAKLEAAFSGKSPGQDKTRVPQAKLELATPNRMPQTKQELAIPARVPQTRPELATSVVRPQIEPVLPSLPWPRPAASGLPYRPLPPIESSTEDLYEDYDREWTYEPLDKFNLYNV